MKKRLLQILVAICASFIIMAVFFLVDNVVLGEKEAEAKVNAYEEAHNMHPNTIEMKYDWYSGGGYIGENYRYNPEKDIIFDEEYNELWYEFFDDKMEEVKSSMDYSVIIEDYSLITYFDGTDATTRYDDLFIYGVYNAQPVAEEKRVEAGAEIIMEIISEMDFFYNFCGVHIDYYDLSGVYRYSISMDREKITKEMLMENATEVSFDGNLAIEEKWEAFCDQRVTFWTLDVDGYEVSMVGMKEYGDYQLVIKDGDIEKIAWNYRNYDTDPREYKYGTFDNVLGYAGFYVFEMPNHYFPYGNFYTIQEGELICIAHTWGNLPESCYSVDVDKNGVPELICNVMYGTGERAAVIYYNNGTEILEGYYEESLLGIDYDKIHSIDSRYLPEENVIEINYYWRDTGIESKKYEINLDSNFKERCDVFYSFEAEECKVKFEDILGYSGFILYREENHAKHGYYCAVEDGKTFCIAETWGTNEREAENFVHDVDDDGITELICNVTYVDGGVRTYVYHNDGMQILRGNCDELLDDERYVHNYFMNRITNYDAKKNVIVINYYLEDVQEWKCAEYEIDFEKIVMEPYQELAW